MAATVFILATDLQPGVAAWGNAEQQAVSLSAFAARTLGFTPRVRTAWLPAVPSDDDANNLSGVLNEEIADGASDVFVLPSTFELNLWQRTKLGQALPATVPSI